jgi:hypothetical protein
MEEIHLSVWHKLWIINVVAAPLRRKTRGLIMDSQTLMIVAVTVVVCALIGTVVWIAVDRARSRRLREHFGPEYDRLIERTHDRSVAEAELQQREQRVKKYRIVPLSAQDRAHFAESWAAVQNQFVDNPKRAVKEGHALIMDVMEKRGYPVTDFEHAAADLSVEYPALVSNYRAASEIASRNRAGEAGTEDLRKALVHYRALFQELLEGPAETAPEAEAPPNRLGATIRTLRERNRGGLRP